MLNQETPEQAEARLLIVIASTQLQVFEGVYTFEELPARHPPNPAALACVRDGEVWSQLVPVSSRTTSQAMFKMFSFHFAEGLDASGFVGWLAAHLKRTLGTGVIVICGKDQRGGAALYEASQGVFDYWGCPPELGDAVIAEVQSLIDRGRKRAA
jgi:hypothetical protein